MSASPSPRPASLEELNALGGEIVALVRAGIPLETGLASLGGSTGRLAELAAEMHDRLERGETLADATPVRDDAVGDAYRTIVTCGTRSGRLADGLEAFVRVGRAILDFRRRLLLAVIHPVIVLSLVFAFLVWFLTVMLPGWQRTYDTLGLELPWVVRLALPVGGAVAYWWWIGPVLLVAFVTTTVWYGRSGRLGPLGLIPFASRTLREYRAATFCDLLSVLTGQGVPLPDALRIAGRACGDPGLAADAEYVAGESREGAVRSLGKLWSIPPFARWMLAAGERDAPNGLAAAGSQAAEVLRRRAARRMAWIRTLVPVVLTTVVGGTTVLVYALLLWLPFIGFLNALS